MVDRYSCRFHTVQDTTQPDDMPTDTYSMQPLQTHGNPCERKLPVAVVGMLLKASPACAVVCVPAVLLCSSGTRSAG